MGPSTGKLSELARRMTPETRARWLRRGRRAAWAFGITLASIAVLGFFVVPPIARSVAAKQLSELLGREVKIAKIRLNPFALSLAVEGFEILEADRSKTFVGFSRLYVNAQLSSLFRRGPVVHEIRLESPQVHVVRTKAVDEDSSWGDVASAYNFSDIVARMAARPKSPEPEEPPDEEGWPRFAVSNIRIQSGTITFHDKPSNERHALTELTVGVPFVSTLPVYLDSFVEPGLSVKVDGTPFVAKGRTKPFRDSLETVLELRLSGLDLTRYVPFVPMAFGFAIDSARLSLALDLSFVRQGETPSLAVGGDVALEKVSLTEKGRGGRAPLLGLEKLAIKIGRSDITAQRFKFDRVLVSGLDVHARRLSDGTMAFLRLLPAADAGKPSGAKKSAPAAPVPPPGQGATVGKSRSARSGKAGKDEARFTVDDITVEKTAVHFRDESVRPAFETEVRDIAVSVKGLSNAPGAVAKTALSLQAVPGGAVTHSGTVSLAPLAARGVVAVEDVEPARLAPYYREQVAFDVLRGRVRLGSGYTFEQGKDPRSAPAVRLSDAFVEVADLALRRRDSREDFFRLPSFAVKGAAVDVRAQTVSVADVTTRGGQVRAMRDAKGVIDLTTLVPSEPAPGAAPASRPNAKSPADATAATPAAGAEGPKWTIALRRLQVDKWGVRFEDRALRTKAVTMLEPIAIDVTDFSTARDSKAAVDVRIGINRTGRFEVKGNVGVEPLAANVRFDARRLALVPVGPYAQEELGLLVSGGEVSLRGRATVSERRGGDHDIVANADIEVADLATVDADQKEPLVGWQSLRVSNLRFTSRPAALAIGEVALGGLSARVITNPDGTLNLQKAFAPPAAGVTRSADSTGQKQDPRAKVAAKPANSQARQGGAGKPEDELRITIDKVTLERNQVVYQDRTVKPTFAAEIGDFRGQVTGLSSTPGTTADVNLSALVNRTGALSISGKVNPLADNLFVDLEVGIKDVELPPATPYSAKYAGLPINKGKLGLALDYEIANRKLAATNRLLVDQLTFGDKVDSPDATNLPVRLAVALLRDRNGLIDVTLPIEGSLDDPEFKIWRAVLKVIGNLLVKAATSPFSLIASAFGGGDELSRVDFPPGTSDLDATGKKRIGLLAKVLQERPAISFELAGRADPKRDGEGLKRFLVERKIKAKKMAELVEQGIAVPSPDAVTIPAEEREKLTREAYDDERFVKPKNALGFTKRLPVPEMEKLMLANTRVTDDDLRALALRRATAVQAGLVKASPGSSSRLFLVTPEVASGAGSVELKLKN